MIGVVDIGGTKVLGGVSLDGQEILRTRRINTPPKGAAEALIHLLDEVRDGAALDFITMSVPGPFDRSIPGLVNPPGLPASWHGLDLQATVGDHFDCQVVAENDANCSALAEAMIGAGRGQRTVVYFTVSTGIGTGVVRDGVLDISRHDNEGGHVVLWPRWLGGPPCDCGGHGCLETLASGRAIARRFGHRSEELEDPQAWEEIGRWLGLGIVDATALIDPDMVILGGGVTKSWDRFSASLLDEVERSLYLQPAPAIARAVLDAGTNNLLGALLNLANTLPFSRQSPPP